MHFLIERLLCLVMIVTLTAGACQAPGREGIDEARAIEIARQHVTFEPETVETERATENGRPVWRVTFRGRQGPHPMGGFMIITVDRETGDVVGLAQS